MKASRAMQAPSLICVLAFAGVFSNVAQAAVRETGDGMFLIETTVMSTSKPAAVYAAITRISSWRDPAHTWSGLELLRAATSWK